MSYLNRFGYLNTDWPTNPQSLNDPVSEVSKDSDHLRKALRKFQEMMGLKQTGELDEATEANMAMPRCGVPDFGSKSAGKTLRRRKRFVTLGIYA